MTDSWFTFGAKIALTLTLKWALNWVVPGSGLCVDFVQAGYDYYKGDKVGAAINAVSGAFGVYNVSQAASAKEVMKSAAKENVVETLEETAKVAKKKVTKIIGDEFRKKMVNIMPEGKERAIEEARELARFMSKKVTKAMGEHGGKEIARGVIPEAVETVLEKATTLSFKHKIALNFISDNFQEIEKPFVGGSISHLTESFLNEITKKSREKVLFDPVLFSAAIEGASKESKNLSAKLLITDYVSASVQGAINFQTKKRE